MVEHQQNAERRLEWNQNWYHPQRWTLLGSKSGGVVGWQKLSFFGNITEER